MFDHDGVKTLKIFELSFCMSNMKSWSPVKYKVEGPNKHNLNQFMASQNLLYNFFKWILSVIFSPRSSVFEAHFQEPSTLHKAKIAMVPLHKILNRKIIIIHFQNRILDAKTRLQKESSKNINY